LQVTYISAHLSISLIPIGILITEVKMMMMMMVVVVVVVLRMLMMEMVTLS